MHTRQTRLAALLLAIAFIALSLPFTALAQAVPAASADILNFRATKATTGGKLTLKWSKVKKADGYEVYCCPPGETEYKLLKTVTKNSFSKGKHTTGGLIYQYKVRAVRMVDGVATYGEMSKVIDAWFAKKPKTLKVTSTAAGKVHVKYTAPGGAVGMQIYTRTEDEAKFKRVHSQGSDKTSHTFTGLESGTKYFVKVRGYWKFGGRTFYTPFTKIKSVTVA